MGWSLGGCLPKPWCKITSAHRAGVSSLPSWKLGRWRLRGGRLVALKHPSLFSAYHQPCLSLAGFPEVFGTLCSPRGGFLPRFHTGTILPGPSCAKDDHQTCTCMMWKEGREEVCQEGGQPPRVHVVRYLYPKERWIITWAPASDMQSRLCTCSLPHMQNPQVKTSGPKTAL